MMSNTDEIEVQTPAVDQPPLPETESLAVEMPAEPPEAEAAKEEKQPVRERKPKAPKVKKRKSLAHPPYFQMIKEAITSINEKGGSSPYAIAKFMEEKHKSELPANFRKILGLQLKNSVAKDKLIKIKASYKLSEPEKREKVAASTATIATRSGRTNAAKSKENKRRKVRSKAVSKIGNPNATSVVAAAAFTTTRARRSKRSAPAKHKQSNSIKQ